MASSSEGVQKKKRAWRKPREAVGPGVLLETSSEAKPRQKLARISHREAEQENTPTADPKGDEAMDTADLGTEASEEASREKESSSSNGMRNRDERSEGGSEQRRKEGGGAALSSPSATNLVEIDGSVLEGVSQDPFQIAAYLYILYMRRSGVLVHKLAHSPAIF